MKISSPDSSTGRLERAVLAAGLAVALLAAGAAEAATPAKKPAPTKAVEAPAGDAASGGKTFAMRCSACHGAEGIGGPIAPNLTKVYGAHAASGAYAKYSPALKGSGLTWTAANLDAYLASPAKRVPGTVMMATVPSAADRANLVAYLAALKAGPRLSRR